MKINFVGTQNTNFVIHKLSLKNYTANNKNIFALHGFTGSGLDFAPIAQHITDYNFFAPDLIGHGESSAPNNKTPYQLEILLNNLRNIILSLKIKNIILIGYSMGGRIALNLTLNFPDLFSKLVLISSSPGIQNQKLFLARKTQDINLAHKILELKTKQFITYWLSQNIINSQKNIPNKIFKNMIARKNNLSPIGLSHSLRELGAGNMPSLWGKLKLILKPIFLFTGEHDTKYIKILQDTHNLLPKSKFIIIPNSGHAAHLENTSYFIDEFTNII